MATGSAATKREQRDSAGYRQGIAQFEPRCSSCRSSRKSSAMRQSQHDLFCEIHATGVKTHGHCPRWEAKPCS